MRTIFLLFTALILAACEPTQTPTQAPTEIEPVSMNRFSGAPSRISLTRSNTDIAREFLDYHFELESGRKIPVFSRFEGTISVSFSSQPNAVASADLNALVARLRNEARVPIVVAAPGSKSNIVINRISRKQLNSIVRGAACFVVPNVQSYENLRRGTLKLIDWAQLSQRTRAGVFIPNDISPQELRDCLHEEIAQALGPLNDLYRVAETIFNDDNMHRVLTSYDMAILRTTYSPSLRSGMSRAEVAARLPSILAFTNPSSVGQATRNEPKSAKEWKSSIDRGIFSAGGNRTALNRAISIAEKQNYGPPRIALGYFSRGYVNAGNNRDAAISDFTRAYQLYSSRLGSSSIQAARTSVQLASVAISAGELTQADRLLDRAISSARNHQDASLLFNLLGLKAVAAAARGNRAESQRLVEQSKSWAAYAIGTGREYSNYYLSLDKRIRQVQGQS